MTNKLLLPLVAGAMALAHTHSADACSLAAFDIHQVTYWSAGDNFSHGDLRCDLFGDCRLQGWIVAPNTGSNMKAVVMAHGSQGVNDYDEQSLGEYCELTNRLVSNGYVVFWPFRRGVFDVTTAAMVGTGPGRPTGREAGNRFDGDNGGYFQNSGWSAVFYADIMQDGGSLDTQTHYYVSYIEDEAHEDMNDAINFLVGYKRGGVALVDKHHIAFGGHSIGGALAVMASAQIYDNPPTAFISLSGAAMSWSGSDWWASFLVPDAASHTAVVFYDRVLNEDPATPPTFASSNQQYNAAKGHGGGAVIHDYPAIYIPNTDCPTSVNTDALHYWCVHSNFVTKPQWVDIWYPDLLQFLTNHI